MPNVIMPKGHVQYDTPIGEIKKAVKPVTEKVVTQTELLASKADDAAKAIADRYVSPYGITGHLPNANEADEILRKAAAEEVYKSF